MKMIGEIKKKLEELRNEINNEIDRLHKEHVRTHIHSCKGKIEINEQERQIYIECDGYNPTYAREKEEYMKEYTVDGWKIQLHVIHGSGLACLGYCRAEAILEYDFKLKPTSEEFFD